MKVCYFVSTPSVAGGANRSLIDLIKQIKKINKSYEFIAILSNHGTMEEELTNLGINCYICKFANSVKSKSFLKTFGKYIYNCYSKLIIARIIEKERPDIIHNNSLPTTIGMDIALHKSIPYICHIRENIWDGLGMEFYSPLRVKKVIEKANCVIAISDFIKNSYNGFFFNSNLQVINDGIVIDDYYLPNREILKEDNINILIVGVINPQKGQFDAVRAIELLINKGYNVNLTILGQKGKWKDSNQYVCELEEYVKTNNLTSINFLNPISDLEKLKLLRSQFDINLICSSAEGLGRTTIESMLSGAITIAADAGATPEIVKNHVNGLLYKKEDYCDLADCIEWVIKNRDNAKKIAITGQHDAKEKYAIQKYCKEIMSIYEKLI